MEYIESLLQKTMAYRLGIDIGGTFTDATLINEQTGATRISKVSSTPSDPSVAFLRVSERILREAQVDAGEVRYVVHGTTVATNAILTRRGARVGLVTTRGHKQVLHIARSFVPGGLGAADGAAAPHRPAEPGDARGGP